MSVLTTVYCDACGKMTPYCSQGLMISKFSRVKGVIVDPKFQYFNDRRCDLCDECAAKVEAFVKSIAEESGAKGMSTGQFRD